MKHLIKSGQYTIYKDIECEFFNNKYDQYEVVIRGDAPPEHLGFEFYKPNIYYKIVDISEIGEVYSVYTYAIYHGHDISIESSTDDTVLLTTSDKMFYEKYGFEETERFVYRKRVPFDEVELAEERKPARYIESAKTFV